MQLPPTLFPQVWYATTYGNTDDTECLRQCEQVLVHIRNLAKLLSNECDLIISKCNPVVKAILSQNGNVRHVPLQRELGFAMDCPDWGAIPSLASGLPMVGHAVWVPEMMSRSKPFTKTIDEVVRKSKVNNRKMISQAKSTGDSDLDNLAWEKTQAEVDRGIVYKVNSLRELVDIFSEDVVIAMRRSIWERHGNASEWSVRVINDFLAGMQNHASSYCSVHRPATHDDVVAQVIAAREMVPAAMVLSWTSDFDKAYRQVAQLQQQLPLTIVVQFCPAKDYLVFIVSYVQLFGGRTPPQHFSRHPAWWCYVMAPLLGLPLQHTVGDVIATERENLVVACNKTWREVIAIAGWEIPD